ncbi:DNA polymerase sliding clamp 1 [uncultured archaeon]|nr:DNA polymerase sliding clamp 1 [uncultured archaeon]
MPMIGLANAEFLRSSIEAIASFIPEGNFRFNEKGIHFRGMDPSQVLLVDYSMDRSFFAPYDVEPCFVGINLEEMRKIVSRALPNDRVEIDLNDSECTLSLRGELERSFRLPLIDVAGDELKLPDVKFDARVEMNARLLKESLKDAQLFSSSIIVRVKGDKFSLESKGSSGNLLVSSSQNNGVKAKSRADVVSKYSLSYFMNIAKEASPDSTIVLELKSDSPMKASYMIGKSEIRYYLAHMLI